MSLRDQQNRRVVHPHSATRASESGPSHQIIRPELFVNNAPSAKDQAHLAKHSDGQESRRKMRRAASEALEAEIVSDFRQTRPGMTASMYVRLHCKGGPRNKLFLGRPVSESTIRRALRKFQVTKDP